MWTNGMHLLRTKMQHKTKAQPNRITENNRSSIWQFSCHWWHRKLSLRQLTVSPVTTKLSNWRLLGFQWYTFYGIFCHDDVIKWEHFPRYCPLCGEFIGHWWIPLTKASDAELWCFLWSISKQSRRRWFETPSRSLWRHCNGTYV